KAHNNTDEEADKLQLIGRAQVELKRYAEAAENFGLALDRKLAQPAPAAQVILQLVIDHLKALLRAGNYQEAIDFAQKQMQRDPATVGGGPKISSMAARSLPMIAWRSGSRRRELELMRRIGRGLGRDSRERLNDRRELKKASTTPHSASGTQSSARPARSARR